MNTNLRDTAWLLEAMSREETRTPEVVNAYYTLCIPFYREFLGAHWHTGFYDASGAIGPLDQLRMEALVAQSVAIKPGDRVLDVGCGMGGPACHIAQLTGATVLGLTPNRVQLELAQDLAASRGLTSQVCFSLGTADALPVPDASVDVVLFFESACHFPDRAAFFLETMRVLKPGGRLAGEDWLAARGLSPADEQRYIEPIARTWAIPRLGSVDSYACAMRAAGFEVRVAIDMRDEMALARGFLARPQDRQAVAAEIASSVDPMRRIVMQSLMHLGVAVEAGAFTIGRFVAVKPLAGQPQAA